MKSRYKIIIIDDTNCKSQLADFLEAQSESVKSVIDVNEPFPVIEQLLEDINLIYKAGERINIKAARGLPTTALSMNLKLNAFLGSIKGIKKIILRTSENIYVVNVQDIIRCESDRNYTKFYMNDEKKIMVSRTMKEFEKLLEGSGFFRVHQSHLINLNYVEHFQRGEGGFVVMKDMSSVPVSFRKKDQLLKLFEKL